MTTTQQIIQALEDDTTFGFGEIRLNPSLSSLFQQNEKLHNTVLLFCFGSYEDYIEYKDDFIELSTAAIYKLKQLTLVSEASESNTLSYQLLQEKLHISTLRSLERLLVESIYSKIIDGKLFSQQRYIKISTCTGRDVLLESEPVPKYGRITKVSDLLAGLEKFSHRIDNAFDYINQISGQLQSTDGLNTSETTLSSHAQEANDARSIAESTNSDGFLPDGKRHSSSGLLLIPNQVSMSLPEVSEVNIASSNGRKRKTHD